MRAIQRYEAALSIGIAWRGVLAGGGNGAPYARDVGLPTDASTGSDLLRNLRAVGPLLFPVVLVLAGILVYANSLAGDFVLDDMEAIVRNPAIRRLWPPGAVLRSSPQRPLLAFSLAANCAVGGLDVTGYHVVNITVHLLAGLALYGLVRRTLRLESLRNRYAASADRLAFVVALIWLVHPLNTQAVTYIIQRCESMMGMFFLATMYGYVRGATAQRRWSCIWYGWSATAFGLGLACKEVMVTVLPVLWLYDRCFLAESWRAILRHRGWVHALLLLPLGVAAATLLPAIGAHDATAGFRCTGVTPWEYARSQPGVLLHYLRLSVWPHPLCLYYAWPIEDRGWVVVLTGMTVFALLGSSLWALGRGWRIGFLGGAFFLIFAPTSSVMPIRDLCFEHRCYLPLAALVTAGVLAGHEALRRLPRRLGVLGALIGTMSLATVLGSVTAARNWTYHSAVGMWLDVLEKTSQRRVDRPLWLTVTVTNLTAALLNEGRPQDCVAILQQTLARGFDPPEIYENLGHAWLRLGHLEPARRAFAEALRQEPRSAHARRMLGIVAAIEGRFPEAEQLLQEATRNDPGDPSLPTNLGQCLVEQGRVTEAIGCFQEALQVDPLFRDARERLATTLARAGHAPAALGTGSAPRTERKK